MKVYFMKGQPEFPKDGEAWVKLTGEIRIRENGGWRMPTGREKEALNHVTEDEIVRDLPEVAVEEPTDKTAITSGVTGSGPGADASSTATSELTQNAGSGEGEKSSEGEQKPTGDNDIHQRELSAEDVEKLAAKRKLADDADKGGPTE